MVQHQRPRVKPATNQSLYGFKLVNAADHEVRLNFLGDQSLQMFFNE